MLLTDYFLSEPDETWRLALQCGVTHGTIRLPEDPGFDVRDASHVRTVMERFRSHGITPVIVEPLPNALHNSIKEGRADRDRCIADFITLMRHLHENGITTVCFNFMAHYGWTRTAKDIPERGGASVTGFSLKDFRPDGFALSHEALWENYFYFLRAVLPYAEKYEMRLALHPDDPPLPMLGETARIFTSLANIRRGIETLPSPYLGVTYCQACYHLMGEDAENAVRTLADKIFFVHFRNVRGEKTDFSETFHDNGALDMAEHLALYQKYGVDVPIRVDHVPRLAGENGDMPGYDTLGRLFAIGYLRGLLEGIGNAERKG